MVEEMLTMLQPVDLVAEENVVIATIEKPPSHGFFLIPDQYESLAGVFKAALDQAAEGKGHERHATPEPFEQQTSCRSWPVGAVWRGVWS